MCVHIYIYIYICYPCPKNIPVHPFLKWFGTLKYVLYVISMYAHYVCVCVQANACPTETFCNGSMIFCFLPCLRTTTVVAGVTFVPYITQEVQQVCLGVCLR